MDDIQKQSIQRAQEYLDAKFKDKYAVQMGWLFGIATSVMIYLLAMIVLGY